MILKQVTRDEINNTIEAIWVEVVPCDQLIQIHDPQDPSVVTGEYWTPFVEQVARQQIYGVAEMNILRTDLGGAAFIYETLIQQVEQG